MQSVEAMLKAAKKTAKLKRDAAVRMIEQAVKLTDAERQIEFRENELLGDICREMNGEGKPKHTNKEAREAALMIECMTDQRTAQLTGRRNDARKTLKTTEADHAYQHDLHRSYVATLHALAS